VRSWYVLFIIAEYLLFSPLLTFEPRSRLLAGTTCPSNRISPVPCGAAVLLQCQSHPYILFPPFYSLSALGVPKIWPAGRCRTPFSQDTRRFPHCCFAIAPASRKMARFLMIQCLCTDPLVRYVFFTLRSSIFCPLLLTFPAEHPRILTCWQASHAPLP
jgi:hypothetical protein